MRIIDKVLDEEYIQVKSGYKETIERFQQMQNLSEVKTSNGRQLTFRCNDKGRFEVGTSHGKFFNGKYDIYGTYTAEGEVCQINEKTVVKVRLVSKQILRLVYIVLETLSIIASIVLLIKIFSSGTPSDSVEPKNYTTIFWLVILISANIAFIYGIFKQNKHKDEDLQLMKNEVLKRIKAVENWDK